MMRKKKKTKECFDFDQFSLLSSLWWGARFNSGLEGGCEWEWEIFCDIVDFFH